MKEPEHKRHFQTTAVNMPMVRYNGLEIFECYRCKEHYDIASRTCRDTGEVIKYSIGGPIGTKCPLPRVEECDR